MKDERIEAERELADVARARIGIENLVQLLGVVAGCFDDLPVLELQPNAVEPGSLVNAGGVEEDVALNRIPDRTTENFPVRNVAIAATDNGADILDAEAQVRARPFDFHPV